ncbi:MAG TPA: site-specific integrase [Syntrophorhabdaceae bacterium]|nr:site-specific integrase [Syntrophorhabdaceae bacterium]HQM80773.1 site-specific integrase [Syntrophorhabdaceae bacterium]
MGLYRRNKTYWFSIMFDGRRIRKSLETDNKKVAEKLKAKITTELIEGRYFETAVSRSIAFDEMTKKYLSEHAHTRDEHTVKKLHEFFQGFTLFEITTQSVAEYRKSRSGVVKPATVYQELALLRRMFNVAIKEWEWAKDNPVSRLSFSIGNKNARDRWLTIEKEKILLECATNPQWLRTLLMVALHSGLRRGEILNLSWADIDLKRRIIEVVKSKNGEKRAIPMSNTLYDVFANVKVRAISGPVFPISVRSLRVAFEKTLKKAEIQDFKFHDLRHTFATRLVQNGVDIYKVKELLGHKSITMTMRYAHHYPESLRGSIEILDSCHNFVTTGIGAIDI